MQGISGLSNIAQNLGININNSGSFDYYIPDLIDSRTLQEALILNKWNTEVFVDSVNLIEFWEIDESDSFIGSILNKLPPELRRAGRDVVNTIKQRVPIGAVTGGKVFPPLF